MAELLRRANKWLLPTLLILFIIEIIALPFVVGLTYAGRSEEPDHILTYTKGKLTWDNTTLVNSEGVAKLNVFGAVYENVKSEDGRNIIAPGTEGYNIIRLKNKEEGKIEYTALLYVIKTDESIPVKADLTGESFKETSSYKLPANVTEQQVVKAVKGTLGGGQLQDFDIKWLWQYFDSELQDEIDTVLGSNAANNTEDTLTLGLYITVEDNNSYVTPSPYTGDDPLIGMYITLLIISAILIVILFIDRKRQQKCAR